MIIYSIYKVANSINNKVYIGYSQRAEERFKEHKRDLFKENRSSYTSHFYNALRKYGIDNFSFDIIYQSLDYSHTKDFMEDYFINDYNSINAGYNSKTGGSYGKHSTNSKIKMAESHKGLEFSDEHRNNLSKALTGRIVSSKTSLKLSIANTGKVCTKETKIKLAEINYKSYKITHSNGIIEITNRLKEFSNLNNLNYCCMLFVANGKQNHHKGFKCEHCTDHTDI